MTLINAGLMLLAAVGFALICGAIHYCFLTRQYVAGSLFLATMLSMALITAGLL